MDCPSCGSKLERGFINSIRPIYWSYEKKKTITSFGEKLVFSWGSFTTSVAKAYRCKNCKLVLFYYGKE